MHTLPARTAVYLGGGETVYNTLRTCHVCLSEREKREEKKRGEKERREREERKRGEKERRKREDGSSVSV